MFRWCSFDLPRFSLICISVDIYVVGIERYLNLASLIWESIEEAGPSLFLVGETVTGRSAYSNLVGPCLRSNRS